MSASMKGSRKTPDWGDENEWRRSGGDEGWWRAPVGSGWSSSSKRGKPPPPPGSWVPAVPSWERRFCTDVCRIPWKKICETQKMMSVCYRNVVRWDDSAGKEAFENAKARFFAEINRLPCQISSPNPDIFIDEINWDAEVDPQLVLELEMEDAPLPERDGEPDLHSCILLSSDWDPNFPCSGWGDPDDDVWKLNSNDPWELAIMMEKKRDIRDQWLLPRWCEYSEQELQAMKNEDDGQQNWRNDHVHQAVTGRRRRRRRWRGPPQ